MKKQLNKKELKKTTAGSSAHDEAIDAMYKELDEMIKDGTVEANKHFAILKAYVYCLIPRSCEVTHLPYKHFESKADQYIRKKTGRFGGK